MTIRIRNRIIWAVLVLDVPLIAYGWFTGHKTTLVFALVSTVFAVLLSISTLRQIRRTRKEGTR